jgi:hypothetical protein
VTAEENAPVRPVLRIVRGTPTDTELAALVAAVAGLGAASAAAADPPPVVRSWWADRGAMMGARLMPGPGAWRAAYWRR